MAAIDQISRSDLGPGLGDWGEALDEVKERVLDQVRLKCWRWFRQNALRVLYSKKIFFWTISIRVKDLAFIFEELFGKEPTLG